MPDGQRENSRLDEKWSRNFDIQRVSTPRADLDVEKLAWLNGQ